MAVVPSGEDVTSASDESLSGCSAPAADGGLALLLGGMNTLGEAEGDSVAAPVFAVGGAVTTGGILATEADEFVGVIEGADEGLSEIAADGLSLKDADGDMLG